jgi:integrase
MKLTDIGQEKINQIRLLKQKDTVNGKTEVKPRTVNAILNLIRSILRAAVEWEWIDRAPVFKMLAEPTRRVRYLSQDEERALLNELPLHLKQITRFALSTGLRMSNILTLEWSQIDITRQTTWIHADQAKANKAISIPLNTDAMAIIHEQLGQHASHVFSYKDKPILRANGRAWREAVKRANIQDFNFHCLRHTWASRLIQAGVPTHTLMELGGWADIAMVRKYAHFGEEHLREYANKIIKK